ncbi:GNAT family N-acetyltransferase [Halovenus sp. WSH3]|uniref:GNAT family N-acetyltransferase n=1 Tax=Halovenus carboxidivorans TaxID=2692199 RepID=A0A6B0SXQ0_9EURY|nr:GNAT family N-acetyltransferase [Halovenus carboxidivorans]MXR50508.1 GNAT family N-acetyltransferase [Halovenus carboxidivorans]
MEALEKPEISHDDRRDVYEYVEREGATRPGSVRRALGMEKRQFGHHVAILKRDNVIEEVDGKLRIAFDAGDRQEYETEEVSYTIRQAREEDLTGLVGAIRAAIGSGEYVKAETVADIVDSEGVLIRHNEIESRMFFVACVEGDVVGWVHLKHVDLEKLKHTAELTLGVLEAYRGQGIGSHLLEHGVDWADDQGLEKLYNAIPAKNQSAIDFLEDHGFETEAVREDHYKLNGHYIDEVMMAREL